MLLKISIICYKQQMLETHCYTVKFTVLIAQCAMPNGTVVCMLCPKISTSLKKLAPTGLHGLHVFATLVLLLSLVIQDQNSKGALGGPGASNINLLICLLYSYTGINGWGRKFPKVLTLNVQRFSPIIFKGAHPHGDILRSVHGGCLPAQNKSDPHQGKVG